MIRYVKTASKKPFTIKPITKLLQREIKEGTWLDPFANDNTIKKIIKNPLVDLITNDLNPKFKTNYNMEAIDFLKKFANNSIDGILYDPPYSLRQVKEIYNNIGIKLTSEDTRANFWSDVRKEIMRILKNNGKVIKFGWNSNTFGKNFSLKLIILLSHGGVHNDTIVSIHQKHDGLDGYLQ